MNDPRFLRDPAWLKALAAARPGLSGLEEIAQMNEDWRKGKTTLDEKLAEKKKLSGQFGQASKAGGEALEALKTQIQQADEAIEKLEHELPLLEAGWTSQWMRVPHLPDDTVPRGAGEEDNVPLRTWGTPPALPHAQPHWDIATRLGLIDFERGVKTSGSGFVVFTGLGARLVRALMNFMLDLHLTHHGYTEVWTPALVLAHSMTGTGQLPKFAEDMYHLAEDALFLIPTAEVPITNLHREEILDESQLPIAYCGYTPCFRREAGAAGRDTRGIIRLHQFDKVELVHFVKPEDGAATLEALTGHAEAVLKALELPYRVLALCTGDLGFASAKTYDLEVWFPSQDTYREISSCSWFKDFQSRRLLCRYKSPQDKKPTLVHTLNGSGVAIGRCFAALLENGLQPDGSVVLPAALTPYMGGIGILEA